MSVETVKASLAEADSALNALRENTEVLGRVAAAGEALCKCLQAEGRIFSCGNGGSMCDAMHFAEELSGRFRMDRPAFAATAISDPSHLTCAGNDYGFEAVFSRYVEANGKSGDALIAISTSGTSANIIKAAEAAKERGITVISLTGKENSPLGDLADLDLCTPGGTRWSDRVQELHIKLIHILIEIVEAGMANAEAKAK